MHAFTRGLNKGINVGPLRTALRRLAAGIALLALAWPLPALADCVDGVRKPTAAEIDFHDRAMAALVAALPPAPAGATLGAGGDDINKVSALGVLCSDQKTGEFELIARRYYVLKDQKAAVRMAINMTKLPATATVPLAAYGTASPGRSAGLKVNNVVWSVNGPDTPLRQALAEAIDRTRLQGLVGRPLPSVAESRAQAAQAAPASVAGSTVAAPAAAAAAPAPHSPPAQSAAQPAASPSAPAAAGQAGASDPGKDAVDTVNRLRGLFGR